MNKLINSISRKKYSLIGIMSIILGLTYLFHIYGNLGGKVVTWGLIAIIMGIYSVLVDQSKNKFIRGLLSISTILILAMQPLLIDMHWRGISNVAPGSKVFTHWILSFPHIGILIFCFVTILQYVYTEFKNGKLTFSYISNQNII